MKISNKNKSFIPVISYGVECDYYFSVSWKLSSSRQTMTRVRAPVQVPQFEWQWPRIFNGAVALSMA